MALCSSRWRDTDFHTPDPLWEPLLSTQWVVGTSAGQKQAEREALHSTSYSVRLENEHWRTEGGGGLRSSNPPPRNSEGPPKSCQTYVDCENC